MEGHPNLIVEWDFRGAISQRRDYSLQCPYSIDRWSGLWVPEIVRRWQEWKRLRDEWAEFLRTQSSPRERPLCWRQRRQLLKYTPNFP